MLRWFPFNFEDTGTRFSHGLKRWQRQLFKQESNLYAHKLQEKNWPDIKVEMRGGQPCHICGFSMVTLTFANGWVLDTCPANESDKGINGERLQVWVNQVAEQCSYNRSELKSKVLNLQPPGD